MVSLLVHSNNYTWIYANYQTSTSKFLSMGHSLKKVKKLTFFHRWKSNWKLTKLKIQSVEFALKVKRLCFTGDRLISRSIHFVHLIAFYLLSFARENLRFSINESFFACTKKQQKSWFHELQELTESHFYWRTS